MNPQIETICNLCDLFTHSVADHMPMELAKTFNQQHELHVKEILNLSTPKSRLNDLNIWHLERMAVGEYGDDTSINTRSILRIKSDTKAIKQQCKDIFKRKDEFIQKWEDRMNELIKQREDIKMELENRKEDLKKKHTIEMEKIISKETQIQDTKEIVTNSN